MDIPVAVPHREIYWQIPSPYHLFIYPLALIAIIIFAYGFHRRYRFWRAGQPDVTRFGNWGNRIGTFLLETLFQTRVLRDIIPGFMHVLIFWSFLILLFTTAMVFLEADFGIPIYRGAFYLILTILSDLAGPALFAGLVIAAWRRYISRNKRLENKWDDAVVLVLLGLSVLTGFLMEGMRIAATDDKWASWSPIGLFFSRGFEGLGEPALGVVFQFIWWLHFAFLFAFIAIIPFTKFLHIFVLPLNVLFRSLDPKGSLRRPDIEALMESEDVDEDISLGVSEVRELTWKQRLDLDACIVCGRCQDSCPAFLNDKPLNPKRVILDLKEFAHAEFYSKSGTGESGSGEGEKLIVGGAFTSEPIWECRTCRACMEVCPAHIEHIPLIAELRRAEVMMRGQLPTEGSQALVMLERGGNPFGPQATRSDWIREAGFPVVGKDEACEALFYVGCVTTFDLLKQKIAADVIGTLKRAGVNVAVLGDEEQCCGDPARLLGDENLFQTAAKMQLEAIKSRKFDYLVTHCPHGYSNFKNEYPQFGKPFQVFHHTELIYRLIREGKIRLPRPIDRKITYHDPCYLGRYNDIYDQPREILRSISGVKLVEMKHNRQYSRCCGGGGGHLWMDLDTGRRINVWRVEEALETGADTIAVACVYCLQMLNDAVKILDVEDRIEVRDIAELVAEAMGEDGESAE